MADLTPNDIINKEFRLGLRGYVTDQVDEFLQQVSDSLYRALEENQRLRAQQDSLRDQLQHYQQTEGLIKNALMLAERTAEEVRDRARQEADLIRREAQDRIRAEQAELEELRRTRLRILAEIRGVLSAHLSLLEAQEHRPATPAGVEGERR